MAFIRECRGGPLDGREEVEVDPGPIFWERLITNPDEIKNSVVYKRVGKTLDELGRPMSVYEHTMTDSHEKCQEYMLSWIKRKNP